MDTPRVEVDEVIATELLERRAPRVRNAGAEAHSMEDLKLGLAGSPRTLLQKLSDVALRLCGAQSAGVGLYEETSDRCQCRFLAASGEYQTLLWTTLPCALSPCGALLERREPILMIEPQRHYETLQKLRPPIVELLLVPFTVRETMAGSLWVVSHESACRFDAEDRRILERLTEFAGEAYDCLQSFDTEGVCRLSRKELEADPSEPL